HNEIGNDVEGYIANADQGLTTGSLTVTAHERARIRAVAAAGSLAGSAADLAISLSSGGADASNVILTRANAHIDSSIVTSTGDVTMNADGSGPALFTLTSVTATDLNIGSSATLAALRTAFANANSALASGTITLSTIQSGKVWEVVDSDEVVYFITNVS